MCPFPCSFRFFLTWGSNLSILGLSTAFVRHGVGWNWCWLIRVLNPQRSTHPNVKKLLGEPPVCSDLAWEPVVWLVPQSWQLSVIALLDQLRHMSPSSQAVLVEDCFQKGCLFTDPPAGMSVWVALCSWKQTPLGTHLKFILTGLRRQGRPKRKEMTGFCNHICN